MRKAAQLTLFFAGALSAAPVAALDCARATAPVEKAICGDPAAEAADAAMSKAYNALAARCRRSTWPRWSPRKDDG